MIITLRVNNPFEDKVQPALDYCRYVIENPKLAEHRDNFILGDYIKVTDGKHFSIFKTGKFGSCPCINLVTREWINENK